jgi:rhodanese-related sulfurtransferase
MGLLQTLFGKAETIDFKALHQNGAVIIDVRSPEEFTSGHIAASTNIPLQNIAAKTAFLIHQNKPIITVCKSGARSAMATTLLKKAGIETYNGGSWNSLQSKLQ